MKSAVVTGASSGIGEAAARRLDRDGYELLLVARREDRLKALTESLRSARPLALDLTAPEAPVQVAERVEADWGRLDLLVNNAGSAWRGEFGSQAGGYANVRRTMDLNFDALVRLTEALLPIVRRSAPSAIVNVGSIAGRVGLPGSNAYNASKFAVNGWTEALRFEEQPQGVHVGLVLPGFIETEGFPQSDLRSRAATRWMVSTADKVADAIVDAGPGGKAERAVPRPYALVAPLRHLAPGLWRRLGSGFQR